MADNPLVVEAARFYGELMAKARDEVMRAAIVQYGAVNVLENVELSDERSLMSREITLRFQLNGVTHEIAIRDGTALESLASVIARDLVKLLAQQDPTVRGLRALRV